MKSLDAAVPLRVATANIHAKVFDDEVVVLDMGSGTYYSLRGAAATVWPLVDAHATPATIAEAFADAADDDVEAVVRQLLETGIVVADPAVEPGTSAPQAQAISPAAIEIYTDMQDVLLLDPIHEVDEKGWPHALP